MKLWVMTTCILCAALFGARQTAATECATYLPSQTFVGKGDEHDDLQKFMSYVELDALLGQPGHSRSGDRYRDVMQEDGVAICTNCDAERRSAGQFDTEKETMEMLVYEPLLWHCVSMDATDLQRHCVEENVTRDTTTTDTLREYWHTCTLGHANLQKQHTHMRVWYAAYDFEAVGLRCISLSPYDDETDATKHSNGDGDDGIAAFPSTASVEFDRLESNDDVAEDDDDDVASGEADDRRRDRRHSGSIRSIVGTKERERRRGSRSTMNVNTRHIGTEDVRAVIASAEIRCRQCHTNRLPARFADRRDQPIACHSSGDTGRRNKLDSESDTGRIECDSERDHQGDATPHGFMDQKHDMENHVLVFGAIIPRTCQFRYTFATPVTHVDTGPTIPRKSSAAIVSGCVAALQDAKYTLYMRLSGGFAAVSIIVVAAHILAVMILSRHIAFISRDIHSALRVSNILRSTQQPSRHSKPSPNRTEPDIALSSSSPSSFPLRRKRRIRDTDVELATSTRTVRPTTSQTVTPDLTASTTPTLMSSTTSTPMSSAIPSLMLSATPSLTSLITSSSISSVASSTTDAPLAPISLSSF
jgi:hypothetical protein